MLKKLFKKSDKKSSNYFSDGYMNFVSGAGMRGDKSQSGFFVPGGIANNPQALENLYVESWAARKIIDIPVDDMFIYARSIKDMSDGEDDKIIEFQKQLQVNTRIKEALKASRLYGTAFIIMISNDNLLPLPLNLKGDFLNFSNLIVADRFHANIAEWDNDIQSPNFNQPLLYEFTIRGLKTFKIHYTRVIRIDGIAPLISDKWHGVYTREWGQSVLVPLHDLITQEAGVANVANYLLNEASIPILKVPEIQQAFAGDPDAMGSKINKDGQPSIDKLIGHINNFKSIYRTTYLDAKMDMSRLEPNLSNFAELFDKFHLRMAAAADIPETRLFGKCPAGLNSTGDSDAQNYAMHVSAMQERVLRPIYDQLDKLMLKSLRIPERTIEYEFKKLLDISDDKKADIELKNAQKDAQYLANGVITIEEVRKNLYERNSYDIDPDIKPIGIDEDMRLALEHRLRLTHEEKGKPGKKLKKDKPTEKADA